MNTSLPDLRTWAVCWIVCCAACTGAVAATAPCVPEAFRAITFEHVPTDIDAPVIVEATIQDTAVLRDNGVRRLVVMNARIDRVIKGDVDVRTLKIVVEAERCTRADVGQGIVLGKLQDDPLHGAVLEAVSRREDACMVQRICAEATAPSEQRNLLEE